MRPCRFTFDAVDIVFDGFTDNTRWNGFLNVEVTPAEHARILATFGDDEDTYRDLVAMSVNERGRYSLAGGYATSEHDPAAPPSRYFEVTRGFYVVEGEFPHPTFIHGPLKDSKAAAKLALSIQKQGLIATVVKTA